jgi:hypothetical protein
VKRITPDMSPEENYMHMNLTLKDRLSLNSLVFQQFLCEGLQIFFIRIGTELKRIETHPNIQELPIERAESTSFLAHQVDLNSFGVTKTFQNANRDRRTTGHP